MNFQFSIFNFQKQRGFTLVETLVAITILVMAVAAPLTLAAQSLFAAYYAKDQVTASYLAQEAIEVIRQKRDNNLMYILKNPNTVDRSFWLDGLSEGSVIVDAQDMSISSCDSIDLTCAVLQKKDDTIYLHDTNYKDTRFKRLITIEKNPANTDEIKVKVSVRWQTGSFKERTFTIEDNLYNWTPL